MFPDHDIFDAPDFTGTQFTNSRTAVIFHNDFLLHDTGNHPENAKRLVVIMDALEHENFGDSIDWIEPELCTEDDLFRCHTRAQVERIKLANQKSIENDGRLVHLDSDTPVSPGTFQAAKRAVGASCKAVDLILEEKYQNVWGLVRPPGHHSTSERSMGFCIFNNAACAAEYARAKHGLKRIMIVDIDLHHGNGTQDIFYSDPGILYSSIHQSYHYPGTGHIDEIGANDGKGYTVNFPVLAGSGNGEFAIYGRQVIAPIAMQYLPQLLIVSFGVDAHVMDPLGALQVSTEYFAKMVTLFRAIASDLGIGIFFALEGGYSLSALSETMVECMHASVAEHFDSGCLPMPYRPSPVSQDTFDRLVAALSGYWRL